MGKYHDMSGSNNPNWKGGLVSFNCLICGKEKQVKKKDLYHSKYCSLPCARIGIGRTNSKNHISLLIHKICIVCGKDIFVKPSHVEVEGTYCSKLCQRIDYKERMKGSNNPKWKGGITYNTSEYSKHIRKLNLEKTRKYCTDYFARHPEIRKQNNRIYRANKKAVGQYGHFTEKEWLLLLEMYGNKCLCCGRSDVALTRDHIIPLNPGLDTIDNIQPLCQSCNSKKGRKTIDYRPAELLNGRDDALGNFDAYMSYPVNGGKK